MKKKFIIQNLGLNGNSIEDYINEANEIYKTYKIGIIKIEKNKYKYFLDDLHYKISTIGEEIYDNENDAKWKALEELDICVNVLDKI